MKQVAAAAAGLAIIALLAAPGLALAQGVEQGGPPPQLLLSNATTYYWTAKDKVATGTGDPTTDFHEAIRNFYRYLEAVPDLAYEDSVKVYSQIADAHWQISNFASNNGGEVEWTQALEYYDWLIERNPPEEDLAFNYFQAGQAKQKLEGYVPAMDYFEHYLELRPDDLQNRVWVAQIYLSLSNMNRALDHFLFVLDADPAYPEVEAQILNLRNRLQLRYEEITRKLIEKVPGTPQYLFDLARFYLRQARYDEHLQYLQSYLEKRPDDIEAWAAVGEEHKRRGNWDQAQAAYDRILTLEPRNIDAVCAKADIFLQRSNIDAAIQQAKRALQINANHPVANRLMGDAGQQWALQRFAAEYPDRELERMTYDYKLLMKRFADEYYQKALADPAQRSNAQNQINYLTQFFPQPQDRFMWDSSKDPVIPFPPPGSLSE